ncbi:hypothetical protein ON010_g17500 [Phytophthora cinnamomi]|nr:hypothetical protein ON010_g17500 [Phytophthora cinnamomi]
MAVYVLKQTFAIPGSALLNVFAGAVLPLTLAFPLVPVAVPAAVPAGVPVHAQLVPQHGESVAAGTAQAVRAVRGGRPAAVQLHHGERWGYAVVAAEHERLAGPSHDGAAGAAGGGYAHPSDAEEEGESSGSEERSGRCGRR